MRPREAGRVRFLAARGKIAAVRGSCTRNNAIGRRGARCVLQESRECGGRPISPFGACVGGVGETKTNAVPPKGRSPVDVHSHNPTVLSALRSRVSFGFNARTVPRRVALASPARRARGAHCRLWRCSPRRPSNQREGRGGRGRSGSAPQAQARTCLRDWP